MQNHKRHKINTVFFFLLGDYSVFNKNISANNSKFRSLIKYVADYFDVGLCLSYVFRKDKQKFHTEVRRLREILHRNVTKSRQHFCRLEIPYNYRKLIDVGIREDYSMGYVDRIGFRSGTSRPFYFYDLGYESATLLKIHPFSISDEVLKDQMKLSAQEALQQIKKNINMLEEIGGVFTIVWHNKNLSTYRQDKQWRIAYIKMIKYITFLKDENTNFPSKKT